MHPIAYNSWEIQSRLWSHSGYIIEYFQTYEQGFFIICICILFLQRCKRSVIFPDFTQGNPCFYNITFSILNKFISPIPADFISSTALPGSSDFTTMCSPMVLTYCGNAIITIWHKITNTGDFVSFLRIYETAAILPPKWSPFLSAVLVSYARDNKNKAF